MIKLAADSGLDDHLMLDGTVLVVDPAGDHWVRFVVRKVDPSPERPHGISYALTLHAADGERFAGYDNAHAVNLGSGPSKRKSEARDHRHRHNRTFPYAYQDAATLLLDFWTDVEAVLHERGVTP